jgi:hypothetical protein
MASTRSGGGCGVGTAARRGPQCWDEAPLSPDATGHTSPRVGLGPGSGRTNRTDVPSRSAASSTVNSLSDTPVLLLLCSGHCRQDCQAAAVGFDYRGPATAPSNRDLGGSADSGLVHSGFRPARML